jgi:hypothetical protein
LLYIAEFSEYACCKLLDLPSFLLYITNFTSMLLLMPMFYNRESMENCILKMYWKLFLNAKEKEYRGYKCE